MKGSTSAGHVPEELEQVRTSNDRQSTEVLDDGGGKLDGDLALVRTSQDRLDTEVLDEGVDEKLEGRLGATDPDGRDAAALAPLFWIWSRN